MICAVWCPWGNAVDENGISFLFFYKMFIILISIYKKGCMKPCACAPSPLLPIIDGGLIDNLIVS